MGDLRLTDTARKGLGVRCACGWVSPWFGYVGGAEQKAWDAGDAHQATCDKPLARFL